MSESNKSLAQQYYEEVESLKQSGMGNADAVRETAKKHVKSENAVRSSIHQYKTRSSGSNGSTQRRSRRSASNTVEDHLAAARRAVEEALKLIDREVEDAKATLDAAQAHYDEVNSSVKDRKADLEKKLNALS